LTLTFASLARSEGCCLGMEKDASLRLLQPTHDTSTQLAARFPTALPSSRRASRPGVLPARAAWPTQVRVAFAFLLLGLHHRVELRLTANLQLWLRCNPASRLRAEPGNLPRRAPRVPGGAVIDGSSTKCFPAAACSAAAEHADLPLTSFVVTAPSGGALLAEALPRGLPPGPSSAAASSKATTSSNQDAFHRRVPLPGPATVR